MKTIFILQVLCLCLLGETLAVVDKRLDSNGELLNDLFLGLPFSVIRRQLDLLHVARQYGF